MLGKGPLAKVVGSSIGLVKEYRADQKERKATEQASKQEQGHGDSRQEAVSHIAPSDPFSSSSFPATPPDYYIAELDSGQYGYFPATGEEKPGQSLPLDYQEQTPIDPETLAQDLDEARQAAAEAAEASNNHHHVASATTTTVANSNDVNDLIQAFIARHEQNHPTLSSSSLSTSSAAPPTPSSPLPAPVLIPQRRPQSQHRGFVRAYSPALASAGIPQDTWLDFLDTLEASIKAGNSWFKVANAAVTTAHVAEAVAAGFSPVTFLVAMAVEQGVEAGRKVYLRGRQNGVLNAANDGFFGKRGVYVMVVKYKPGHGGGGEGGEDEVDLNGNVTRMVDKKEKGKGGKWDTWMRSSPNTVSSFGQEMPPVAPLIFPSMEEESVGGKDGDGTGKKRSSGLKGFGEFLEDYHDRQAQAKLEARQREAEGEDGAGALPQVPRKEFASSFSDPNHAVNKGGLLSMATGGKVNPQRPELGNRRRGVGLIGGGLTGSGGAAGSSRGGRGGGRGGAVGVRRTRGGLVGTIGSSFGVDLNINKALPKPGQKPGIKGLMKEDALYLMVVNMPSAEEIERAMAVVNEKARVEGNADGM